MKHSGANDLVRMYRNRLDETTGTRLSLLSIFIVVGYNRVSCVVNDLLYPPCFVVEIGGSDTSRIGSTRDAEYGIMRIGSDLRIAESRCGPQPLEGSYVAFG